MAGGSVRTAGDHVGSEGPAASDELELIEALRAGSEEAFADLIDRHHSGLVRLAISHVGDRSVAEEVVQEGWIAVLRGIDRFEGRSRISTWLYRIVSNLAKTRAAREHRSVAFSRLDDGRSEGDTVFEERFFPPEASDRAGMWISPPGGWDGHEERLMTREALAVAESAIQQLPERQRTVIVMRDVEGLDAEAVRNVLEISATNQRVLLHRARIKVRDALEEYLQSGAENREADGDSYQGSADASEARAEGTTDSAVGEAESLKSAAGEVDVAGSVQSEGNAASPAVDDAGDGEKRDR